jgi:hypothetical protein
VYDTLDEFHAKTPISLLVHGACESRLDIETGLVVWSADELAEQWAKHAYVPYLGVPAVWYINGKFQGKKAGPQRNTVMLKKGKPEAAIGFPGGKGTANMAEQLIAAGIIPQMVLASSAS